MKRPIVILVALVTLVIASSASASSGISYVDYPAADGNDPTVKTCEAYSWMQQKCRDCRPNWNPDGSMSSSTCIGVTVDKFCSCGTSCRPRGLCTYR